MTGFLNVQRLILESEEGKKASQKLQNLKHKKEKELIERKTYLDKIKEDIEKSSKDDKEASTIIKDYSEKEKELKRQIEDADIELKAMDKELTEEFLKKASPMLNKVAKKRKYTMIITNPTVVGFVDPAVDITSEVIQELNAHSK